MNQPHADNLIQRFFAEEVTPELVGELDAWLRADPANARLLAEYGLLEQMMVGQQVEEDASSVLSLLLEMERSAEPIELAYPTQESFSTKPFDAEQKLSTHEMVAVSKYLFRKAVVSKPAIFAYAAAVVLLIAVILVPWGGSSDPASAPIANTPEDQPNESIIASVATLTGTHEAQWASDDLRVGTKLKAGDRLTLSTGFAEIETHRGAVAVLEGPCTIELLDNNAVHLKQGKLVGLCHTESSKGFIVKTDYADITDLGTEFGVEVMGDRSLAAVFNGRIEVTSPDGSSLELTKQMTAVSSTTGQSVRAVSESSPDRLRDQFTRRLPRPALVTNARLLGPAHLPIEVVPQATYEQVQLFTDRTYVLRSAPDQPLPKALRGGDLVRMPVDARTGESDESIKVELELAEPAQVYLLFWEEEQQPDWLIRDYQKTEERVHVVVPIPSTDTQQDFDSAQAPRSGFEYAVWQRKQIAQGTVIVAQSAKNSMYSIVAVPATTERR